MDFKEALEKNITIYWWNMGKKTLDFEGSYNDYFKKRGIKITPLKHKAPKCQDINGLRFVIPLSSCKVTLDDFSTDLSPLFSTDLSPLDAAVRTFLALMGDKALFINGYGRKYTINF